MEFNIFRRVTDLKTLPWFDVQELLKLDLINESNNQLVDYQWRFIKRESKTGFKNWKPQQPKIITSKTEIDPLTNDYVNTLRYKKPKIVNTIPFMEMEQDFSDYFLWWYWDSRTGGAVIALRERKENRVIKVLVPMWSVHLCDDDIYTLYWNPILMDDYTMDKAMQFQRVVNVCYHYFICSERPWRSKWKGLEDKIEKKKAEQQKEIDERVKRASWARFRHAPSKPYKTPQGPSSNKRSFEDIRREYRQKFLNQD